MNIYIIIIGLLSVMVTTLSWAVYRLNKLLNESLNRISLHVTDVCMLSDYSIYLRGLIKDDIPVDFEEYKRIRKEYYA